MTRLASIGLAAILALFASGSANAGAMTIYDSLYHPLPSNTVSEGYQCCQNSSFGDEIQFAGTYRDLSIVTLTLSDWAAYSDVANDTTYATTGNYDTTGFSIPLTLTLYNVGPGNSLGSVIASQTIDPTILWRPEYTGCDGSGSGFVGADGQCDHGLAQNVSFDFTGTAVPDTIIYALSFDTQTYGENPIGYPGPYNSLNFALNETAPSVGSEFDPTYLWYKNSGYEVTTGTANVLSQNEFGDYVPAIQFTAVPEPPTIALFAAALFGLGFAARRRRKASGTEA